MIISIPEICPGLICRVALNGTTPDGVIVTKYKMIRDPEVVKGDVSIHMTAFVFRFLLNYYFKIKCYWMIFQIRFKCT